MVVKLLRLLQIRHVRCIWQDNQRRVGNLGMYPTRHLYGCRWVMRTDHHQSGTLYFLNALVQVEAGHGLAAADIPIYSRA